MKFFNSFNIKKEKTTLVNTKNKKSFYNKSSIFLLFIFSLALILYTIAVIFQDEDFFVNKDINDNNIHNSEESSLNYEDNNTYSSIKNVDNDTYQETINKDIENTKILRETTQKP
jgi:hypothetical protein